MLSISIYAKHNGPKGQIILLSATTLCNLCQNVDGMVDNFVNPAGLFFSFIKNSCPGFPVTESEAFFADCTHRLRIVEQGYILGNANENLIVFNLDMESENTKCGDLQELLIFSADLC